MDVVLHFAVHGTEWSASRPVSFTAGKRTRDRRLGGSQDSLDDVEMRKILSLPEPELIRKTCKSIP
jgi:hypothetical protein